MMLERINEKTAIGASLMRKVMTMVMMRSTSLTSAKRGEREDGPGLSVLCGSPRPKSEQLTLDK